MIRRITLLVLVALAPIAVSGVTASATDGHEMGGELGRHMLADLSANAARLGISDETMGQIRTIVQDGMTNAEHLRAELTAARVKLRNLLSAPRPDEAAVMAQAQQIGALDTKLLEQRLQTLLHVRPLLTDAQIEALRAIRTQRLAPVREACRADIASMCADAVSGRDAVHCLRARHDTLSEACRTALADLHTEAPHP